MIIFSATITAVGGQTGHDITHKKRWERGPAPARPDDGDRPAKRDCPRKNYHIN